MCVKAKYFQKVKGSIVDAPGFVGKSVIANHPYGEVALIAKDEGTLANVFRELMDEEMNYEGVQNVAIFRQTDVKT